MTDHAKRLRRSQTDAEAKLWSCLRTEQLGVKFRRQHRLEGYILDFVSLDRRLAIELDGSQHFDHAVYDRRRATALERLGLRVLRFWNHDVLLRTKDVLETIAAALNEPLPPHPDPLPRKRRGRGSQTPRALAAPATSPPAHSSLSEVSNPMHSAAAPTVSPPTVLSLGERAGVRGPDFQYTYLRARLNMLIRDFFAGRGVLEIETPILSAGGNTEPNIASFMTEFTGPTGTGPRTRFLRTSPEHALKRLLAAGVTDCYELGRVFRNGEAGRSHNPEFTLLEWYRLGFDHRRLALECAQLVRAALALVNRDATVTTTTYRNWFLSGLGIDPFTANAAALRTSLRDFSIDPDGLTRDDSLDLLITHRLQPALSNEGIIIVYDFPASQCSLARIRRGTPPVAERFELYLGRHELANGYHELNDAAEQRFRFEHDNLRRRERGSREMPIDENLLAVLDRLPDCAGVALGVDRLLMYLADTDDIRDVLAFPFADA